HNRHEVGDRRLTEQQRVLRLRGIPTTITDIDEATCAVILETTQRRRNKTLLKLEQLETRTRKRCISAVDLARASGGDDNKHRRRHDDKQCAGTSGETCDPVAATSHDARVMPNRPR